MPTCADVFGPQYTECYELTEVKETLENVGNVGIASYFPVQK